MVSRLSAIGIALVATLALSACANTVRGVGADVGNTVDATGQAVDNVVR